MDPLPRVWRSAQDGLVTAWGWSKDSADEALALAQERLASSIKAIRAGIPRARQGSYGWAPPREETLQEVYDGDTLIGIVSRNRYGADVLTTDRLLIADVDTPPVRRVRKLFGRGKGGGDAPKDVALQAIRAFAEQYPALGVRAYETYGGFRVVVTGSRHTPESPEAAALFEQLGTDRTYAHLCRKFNTCRARLTPKPWRCGMRRSFPAWPPASSEQEATAASWLAEYQAATRQFATCRLRHRAGPPPDALERQLVELHDRATGVTSEQLPLA